MKAPAASETPRRPQEDYSPNASLEEEAGNESTAGENRMPRGIKFLLIAMTLGMVVTLAACFTMQKVGCDLLQLTSCPTATPTP
jgi:hypothetical protein